MNTDIDRYLSGEMTEIEHKEFESRMDRDDELKGEVALAEDLILGIETLGLKEKLSAFKHTSIGDKPQNHKIRKLGFRTLSIAASVVIAIGLGIFYLWSPNQGPSIGQDELFATYYSPDPGLPTVMGGSNETHMHNTMNAYKRGDYLITLGALNDLEPTDTVQFYKGMCYFNLKTYDRALPYLKAISLDSEFRQKADWYLLLYDLKIGQLESVKNRAKSITSNANHFYFEEANSILKQITK